MYRHLYDTVVQRGGWSCSTVVLQLGLHGEAVALHARRWYTSHNHLHLPASLPQRLQRVRRTLHTTVLVR